MNVYELIFRKREGGALSSQEMDFMVKGFLDGSIPDYQMSAFLMAVFFRGMDKKELSAFTGVMYESGEKVDLGSLSGPTADKHSTGGVGDGVSLVLAPLAASLGLIVPMMSGRGLGHTGGTLDKLESIPGYNVNLTKDEFIECLKKTGASIIGQTDDIAPADRKLYALRDVTATVDSIPLITASIMSKKLAEGASCLVFDVKTGTGAFMRELADARELAGRLIETGRAYGRKTAALISDMSRPLGESVGNALEVHQAVDIMSGGGPEDFRDLTAELAAVMQVLAGVEPDAPSARVKALNNLSNGRALEKFREMVSAQGGDPRIADDPAGVLPQAENFLEVKAPESGYVSAMDTRRIGVCAVTLGAGRSSMDDKLDFSAGIKVIRKTGDKVERGEVLALLCSTREKDLAPAGREYLEALSISEEAARIPPLIHEVIN